MSEFNIDEYKPYSLSEPQFKKLEDELVERVTNEFGLESVFAVWMSSDNQQADLVRTLEKRQFPEIDRIMEPFEEQSMFLAMVDNRAGSERIVHAFRVTSLKLVGMEAQTGDLTGVALLDEMISADQGLTAEEIRTHYEKLGVDLSRCISVETNFRVGERVPQENGLEIADIGYLALFNASKRLGAEVGNSAIFTHLSHPSFSSMDRVGVEYCPIAGRPDLKTPTILPDGEQGFDDKYTPIEIPASQKNMQLFEDLMPFSAPELLLYRE